MAYPRFRRSRHFKQLKRAAGDVVVTSTTWVAVDSALDIQLDAQELDVLEVGVSSRWGAELVTGYLEFVTIVSGTVTGSFGAEPYSTTSDGMSSLLGTSGVVTPVSATALKVLEAPEVAGGFVTARLNVRASDVTGKVLSSSGVAPLHFWAKNLGPADTT